MAPPLRATLITLGVSDVERAARFYETLGMWGRAGLAKDAGFKNSEPGFSGVALAFNVPDEPSVDTVLQAAAEAGGRIVKPGGRAFWGGYTGYFADPDGHLWEVAHNPGFPLDERGQIRLPE
jgi:uncharacterized protein